MLEKLCRNCTTFRYHCFVGSCKGHDTADMYGKCNACQNFMPKTEEELKELIEYENNVLFPYLEKITINSK